MVLHWFPVKPPVGCLWKGFILLIDVVVIVTNVFIVTFLGVICLKMVVWTGLPAVRHSFYWVTRPRDTVFSSFFDVWVVISVNTLYIKGIYVMLRDKKKSLFINERYLIWVLFALFCYRKALNSNKPCTKLTSDINFAPVFLTSSLHYFFLKLSWSSFLNLSYLSFLAHFSSPTCFLSTIWPFFLSPHSFFTLLLSQLLSRCSEILKFRRWPNLRRHFYCADIFLSWDLIGVGWGGLGSAWLISNSRCVASAGETWEGKIFSGAGFLG